MAPGPEPLTRGVLSRHPFRRRNGGRKWMVLMVVLGIFMLIGDGEVSRRRLGSGKVGVCGF